MDTVEKFFDQLLIGLLVILVAALLLYPYTTGEWASLKWKEMPEVVGGSVLGAAYLLGILFDRFFDTLLEDVEQHMRLRVVLKDFKEDFENAHETDVTRIKDEFSQKFHGEDPMPEDELRIAVLVHGSEVSQYADYLRSRLRLLRAMAAVTPALSVACLSAIGGESAKNGRHCAFAIGVLSIYGFVFVTKLEVVRKTMKDRGEKKAVENARNEAINKEGKSPWRLYRPPKTGRSGKAAQEVAGYVTDWIRERWWWFACQEPAFWGLSVLIAGSILGLAAAGLGQSEGTGWMFAIPFAGLALTGLSGWAWWRITKTYVKFLLSYGKSRESQLHEDAHG